MKKKPKVFQFTPRENQVASLIAKGTPRKQMADALGIKIATLRVYIQNIKNKINADTLYEAGCILAHYY
jgi:DNA-binding NarL/FixJ family response regulator